MDTHIFVSFWRRKKKVEVSSTHLKNMLGVILHRNVNLLIFIKIQNKSVN